MSREKTETVRDVSAARRADGKPMKRLPKRDTTKHLHERLLRALRDRRVKRSFD
jgi:hypothetical protein